jgi:hypothetical protein
MQSPDRLNSPNKLLPEEYEDYLVKIALPKSKADPFKVLGVSNEDKMAFFLLKWIFN